MFDLIRILCLITSGLMHCQSYNVSQEIQAWLLCGCESKLPMGALRVILNFEFPPHSDGGM